MVVIKLLKAGCSRVTIPQIGQTFIVDSFTDSPNGKIAHVRDYRYGLMMDRPYQIWSIGPDGYEIIYPIQLDEIKARDLLIKQIQDALGTAESGLDLVEVARNAHKAEQELASVKRDLELLQESIEHED